jgi:hypothetical protein
MNHQRGILMPRIALIDLILSIIQNLHKIAMIISIYLIEEKKEELAAYSLISYSTKT